VLAKCPAVPPISKPRNKAIKIMRISLNICSA
jgi:hypothetical protein